MVTPPGRLMGHPLVRSSVISGSLDVSSSSGRTKTPWAISDQTSASIGFKPRTTSYTAVSETIPIAA